MTQRTASVSRKTTETQTLVKVNLDGTGAADISTGIGFLDHMLTALAVHGRLDLELQCSGDLDVDDHHTAEDTAILLGQAIDQALGNRAGIVRFASAFAPLDESLARCVIDLSGRPAPVVDLGLRRDMIGQIACENITHWFQTLAINLKASVHIDVLRGENDHHRAEAAFKALALALRAAVALDDRPVGVPSTKGTLT
ncbi:MAG: imidazoleglycerol-phosphate dehydratase HisB [Phycisphaerales bacterium JB058]